HPLHGNYVYLGTDSGAIYRSSTSGGTWEPPQTPASGTVTQIVVDPRGASNPDTTMIYAGIAGTQGGLVISTPGGTSWGPTPALAGPVMSMAFSLPALGTGTADLYVGIAAQGVYYSTDPTTGWTAISGVGLPMPGTFNFAWVAYCPSKPRRA